MLLLLLPLLFSSSLLLSNFELEVVAGDSLLSLLLLQLLEDWVISQQFKRVRLETRKIKIN
jgi:hypothetical protein